MAVTLLWTLKLYQAVPHNPQWGRRPQTSLLQTSWYKEEHFCLWWTTATCPGEMQKEMFSSWGFIAGFWPFPAAPKGGLWLKDTTKAVVTFSLKRAITQWSAPCRENRIILPTPNCSCDVLHYHRSTVLFLFEGKTHGCLQTTASSASPTQTTDQRSSLSEPQRGPQGPQEADI